MRFESMWMALSGSKADQVTIIERDIYGAAHFLIEKHGKGAEFEAAQRADHFLEQGDHDGKNLWLRIMRAIAEMQAKDGTRH